MLIKALDINTVISEREQVNKVIHIIAVYGGTLGVCPGCSTGSRTQAEPVNSLIEETMLRVREKKVSRVFWTEYWTGGVCIEKEL